MKFNPSLPKLLFIIIFSHSLCLASDFHDDILNANNKTIKVADYVQKGINAAEEKNFSLAYQYYYQAKFYLKKAWEDEKQGQHSSIDLSGSVPNKKTHGFRSKRVSLYKDQWSLSLKLVVIANEMAVQASKLKKYEEIDCIYNEVKDFHVSMDLVQRGNMAAARNAFSAQDYEEALEYLDLAARITYICPLICPSNEGTNFGFEFPAELCKKFIIFFKQNGKKDKENLFSKKLEEWESQKTVKSLGLLNQNMSQVIVKSLKPTRQKGVFIRLYGRKSPPAEELTPLLSGQ